MQRISILMLLSLALGSCQQQPETQNQPDTTGVASKNHATITKAISVLHPTEGNNVRGIVTFTKMEGGVMVVADVEGLTPGNHGFHIHEFGDCSAPDATSAGDHYAPEGNPHGAPNDEKRHLGDLGNITAGANGAAHLEWLDKRLDFEGENSILGRALVVHANADDLTSQPSGNAGGRVACGVIGVAQKP
jgi:Cu-Zn family superoxide dismutase